MTLYRKAVDYLKAIFLPPPRRWRHAQSKETHYWSSTPPYYMPWLARLNRFGYRLGDPSSYDRYVDCLPLSTVTARFDALALPPRPVVVDLGCGPCGIGYAITHPGPTYCIDPLLDAYRRLPGYRDNVFDRLGRSKILVCQPGETATIAEAADLLFCINVLDHTERPSAVLDNCARLLKGGGVLFLLVDGYLNGRPFILDPLHPHQFTERGLRRLIERSGFTLLHFEEAAIVHGGRIQQLLVGCQNVGRRKKIQFGEFLAVARKGPVEAQAELRGQ